MMWYIYMVYVGYCENEHSAFNLSSIWIEKVFLPHYFRQLSSSLNDWHDPRPLTGFDKRLTNDDNGVLL